MRQEDERGFLSGKFDDWSGEPVPNGWNSLDRKITKVRYRRNALLAAVPVLLLLSFLPALKEMKVFPELQNSGKQVSANPSAPSVVLLGNHSASVKGERSPSSPIPAAEIAVLPAPAARPEATSSKVKFRSSETEVSALSATTPPMVAELAEAGNQVVAEKLPEFGQNGHAEVLAENHPTSTLNSDDAYGSKFSAEFKAGILPMALKTALLAETQNELKIHFSPKVWQTESPSKMRGPGFQKSLSVQAAYAATSVQLQHAQTEGWKYGIRNSRFTSAGLISAGLRMEKPITRNFGIFYGLESGVWMRNIEWLASSRTAQAYEFTRTSATSYSVSPVINSKMEQRNSLLVFARSEIGVRKAFTRRAGLLAAAQLWARISSKGFTDLENGASFHTSQETFRPGYRVGMWWQLGQFTQTELSYSSSPEALAPATAGAEFNSRLLSLGLRQSF